MKRFILPVLLVFGISLLSSCAKKGNPPASGPVAAMSATVAGTAWTAKTITAVGNAVSITLKGSASDGSYIQMSFSPDVTPGTYTLAQSGSYTFQYSTGVTSYLIKSGTVTVSTYTKNSIIQGTFTCVVEDPSNGSNTKSITAGSFTGLF